MRRGLLVFAVLVAGCGGGDDKAATERTTPDSAATLKSTGDQLAVTLRRAGRVLDRESCGDEERIRSLSEDVTSDIHTLQGLKNNPDLASERPQIVDGIRSATQVRDGLEELLVAC